MQIMRTLAFIFMLVAAPLATAEVKIAVVDVQRAILDSEEAKQLLATLQEEFEDEETSINNLRKELRAIAEQVNKDGEVMGDEALRALQEKAQDIDKRRTFEESEYQRKVQQRQGELFQGFDEKVRKAIESLVLAEDYDLIIPRQAALFVGDLYDVTRKVTERLNEAERKSR